MPIYLPVTPDYKGFESIYIICDYAQAEVKEFCITTFLFNYIIGPVNLVLLKYRYYTQKSREGMTINKKTRMQQLLQFDLTVMIMKFLIKEYRNTTYSLENQPEITAAITYVNEHFNEEHFDHIPPNKISLLFILGYCEILSDAIGHCPNEQTATNNTNPLPFDHMVCHPLSILNNIMDNKICSIPSGRSCIPDLWDINTHF